MKPITLDRDARADRLIACLAVRAVKADPIRREMLLRRAEQLSAYRRRFWTPERMRAVAGGSDRGIR